MLLFILKKRDKWIFNIIQRGHSTKWVLMSLSDDMKVKVTQSCPTPCDPMDYTVHGVLKARILEWVAFPFSRGLSQPRNWTGVSCIAGGFFINWAIRQALLMMQHDTKRIWNSLRIKRTMRPLHGILKLTLSFLQGEGDQRAPSVLMCSFRGWRKISRALNPKGMRGSVGRTVCSGSGFAQRKLKSHSFEQTWRETGVVPGEDSWEHNSYLQYLKDCLSEKRLSSSLCHSRGQNKDQWEK